MIFSRPSHPRPSSRPGTPGILALAGAALLAGLRPYRASAQALPAPPMPPIVAAYVFPNLPGDRPLLATDVDPSRLTRIYYAFAFFRGGKVIEGSPQDAANLRLLSSFKHAKPSLEVMISIGGWLGSESFSDAALTPASRAQFTRSALDFVKKYDLDGLDIDWEYPGQSGAGNRFRPEDGANFSLLLADLRKALDTRGQQVHRPLRLTIAAAATRDFLSHSDMAGSQRSLDQVNLMAYDYYEPGDGKTRTRTGNHAPLFADPADPHAASGANAVHDFEQAGVPAGKLIFGVPFYGHAWADVPPAAHGLFQTGVAAPDLDASYPDIQTMLGKGFTRYWDSASAVPFAYNAATRQFISYEDPESLRHKAAFVRDRHLAGMMFWQYFSDPSGALLGAIDLALHAPSPASGPSPATTLTPGTTPKDTPTQP